MRGRIRTVVAAALLLAALPALPARAAAVGIPCRGTAMQQLRSAGSQKRREAGSAGSQKREVVRVRTFHVVAAPQAKSYKIGTKA
ncbi:MAG TPA: hypothetical protein VIG64_11375, partial [Actinomycetota bacterium]